MKTLGVASALFGLWPMLAAASTPTVTYGTYFGGTGDTNAAVAVAVDPLGNVIMAGLTSSQTLPGTAQAFQPVKATGFPNNRDVFIAKFDPSGRTLLWASFLGGDGDESPTALAVDPTGSVYVVGTTTSSTFPVTSGAYVRSQRQGLTNGFATKISADGRTLLYSTYLPGTPAALAVSSAGEAYITGAFSSGNGVDLLHLNATGTGLVSSTYLGGAGFNGSTTTSLAVSPQGNIYIAGFTAAVN